jgi:hypothetical protein
VSAVVRRELQRRIRSAPMNPMPAATWGREARSRAIANATAFNESKSTISYFLWNRLLCLDFSMMEKCLRTKELHARFGVTLRESDQPREIGPSRR